MEEQEAVVEEKKPSLFSLIEEGGAEQLDKQLEEDEEREEKLSSFSPDGHTPLELAAMLGKEEVAKVLVAKGAEVNATNTSGYTALHMCVAWGYLDCTKSLISLGADPQLRTRHGETVIELALRYKRTECANFLDTVVARKALLALIQSTKEILGDSERISGKWVKDDRQKVNALCTEKGAWLEHNLEASLSSIEEQVTNFNERFAPHLAKLTPPENN